MAHYTTAYPENAMEVSDIDPSYIYHHTQRVEFWVMLSGCL